MRKEQIEQETEMIVDILRLNIGDAVHSPPPSGLRGERLASEVLARITSPGTLAGVPSDEVGYDIGIEVWGRDDERNPHPANL